MNKKQPKKISETYLQNAALYYLQRYATSAENLRRVLHRKIDRSCRFHGLEPRPFYPFVETLLERYKTSGLLNDTQFAEARVSSFRRQGLSKQAILSKLSVKGLSAADIEQALSKADAETEDAELSAAKAYIKRKRLGVHRTKETENPLAKDLASLARAGFSYAVAVRALGDMSS